MFQNKNTLKGFLSIATFLIALLILVFMSAPGFTTGNDSYTCLELVNGFKLLKNSKNVAGFSFLNLIPYLLLVIVLVFEYLKYAVNIFNNRTTRICMSVACIIMGVMFLFGRYMINYYDPTKSYADPTVVPRTIGWGAVIQVIVSFVCAIFCAIDAIVEFEPEVEAEQESETQAEIEDLKATYIEEMKKINNKNDDEQ